MRFKTLLMLGLIGVFLQSTIVFSRVVYNNIKTLSCTAKKEMLSQSDDRSLHVSYLTPDKNGKNFKITKNSEGRNSIKVELGVEDQTIIVDFFDFGDSEELNKFNGNHFLNALATICQEDVQSLRASLKSLLKQAGHTYIFPLNLSTPEAKKALSQENHTCMLSEGKRVGSWFVSHTYECFFSRKSL